MKYSEVSKHGIANKAKKKKHKSLVPTLIFILLLATVVGLKQDAIKAELDFIDWDYLSEK